MFAFYCSYQIRVITKLPNTEQSSKGKGKNQANKQTQSVNNRKTGKTTINDPDLIGTGISKEMVG
jgi:hypothetical protein